MALLGGSSSDSQEIAVKVLARAAAICVLSLTFKRLTYIDFSLGLTSVTSHLIASFTQSSDSRKSKVEATMCLMT